MCLAKKYTEQINEIIDNINNDYENLCKQHSKLDKMRNEQYHRIETENFNASRGFCLSKELQKILQKRRLVKHEIDQLNDLKSRICNGNFIEKIHKANESITKREQGNMRYTENFSVSIADVLNDKQQLNELN